MYARSAPTRKNEVVTITLLYAAAKKRPTSRKKNRLRRWHRRAKARLRPIHTDKCPAILHITPYREHSAASLRLPMPCASFTARSRWPRVFVASTAYRQCVISPPAAHASRDLSTRSTRVTGQTAGDTPLSKCCKCSSYLCNID